ncbi:MAG: gliding motility protein GldN [Sphingobacteriales bacterium]|nr:gliding motility protein GldN [Sphingobacteriales bacterium]
MKSLIVKCCLCLLVLLFAAQNIYSQRTNRKKNNNPATTQPTDTTKNPIGNQQQQVNNNVTPGFDPFANIPIIVDSSGLSDTVVKKSLRNDNAFDKSSLTKRNPLPYENLRWDDALFAEKVWRELDLREKLNKVFQYEANDDNGSQMFINILLKAIKTGEVTAFADERFTTPMSLAEIDQLTAGSADTVNKTAIDDPSKIIARVVTRASFDAKSVSKMRLKEEWVFDRESSRMFCRILGIAPVKISYLPNGQERGSTMMFWIYYPDLRPVLTRYEVYNPKNMGQSRMTWEELFESRMFSSYLIKSTFDNPSNKNIRSYIKDPILALLEGENIKEKIFNFEQDLWSY